MRRYSSIAAVVFTLCTAPLSAELKTRAQGRGSSTSAGETARNDMMAAMVGPMITEYAPADPDGVEMTAIVGRPGIRTEFDKAYVMFPAGGVTIVSLDGTSVGFDAGADLMDDGTTDDPNAAAMLAKRSRSWPRSARASLRPSPGSRPSALESTMQVAIPMPARAEQLPPEAAD